MRIVTLAFPLIAALLLLSGVASKADEAEANVEGVAKELVVSGKLTQIIGLFMTPGRPVVGDTFEIDLADLPQEKIRFEPSGPPNGSAPYTAYVPLPAPLAVERTDFCDGESICLRLAAENAGTEFVVQIAGRETLKKGTKVKIFLYSESRGRILCMAEAEGVLK